MSAIRMLNDGYAEPAHRYPRRIASYVMLPLLHIDAALKEMERGLDQLGCVGVNMHISQYAHQSICTSVNMHISQYAHHMPQRSVAETEFEPVHEEMNRRGAFVHPAGIGICSPVIVDYGYRAAVGTWLGMRHSYRT